MNPTDLFSDDFKVFADFDWQDIAVLLGGRLLRQTERVAEISMAWPDNRTLIFSDNGGEINILEVKRLRIPSIDYWGNGSDIGDMTLADRLHKAINGIEIDYSQRISDAA